MEEDESIKDVIGFKCKKEGHIKPNCSLLKKKGKIRELQKGIKIETCNDSECGESDEEYANI